LRRNKKKKKKENKKKRRREKIRRRDIQLVEVACRVQLEMVNYASMNQLKPFITLEVFIEPYRYSETRCSGSYALLQGQLYNCIPWQADFPVFTVPQRNKKAL
jgi:ribosomal protein S18